MKSIIALLLIIAFLECASQKSDHLVTHGQNLKTTITKTELNDKIKGGWAGWIFR